MTLNTRLARQHSSLSIGFVILSHGNPLLLARLVEKLNRIYTNPPIACHHDFSQAELDPRRFPSNVRFVTPHVATGWGKFSVVSAGLAAMRLLAQTAAPDWFILLSAADYPVRSAALVRDELASSPYDVYLDASPIHGQPKGAAHFGGTPNPKLAHFGSDSNNRLKWQLYLGARVWLPVPKRRPRWRIGRITLPFAFAGRHPFGANFSAYHGDHWFTGNRRTLQALLATTTAQRHLATHLKFRAQADECYYQTILANTLGLRICLDNKRYAEWNGGGAHPETVLPRHVPSILASGAHFARKFELVSTAVDMIDEIAL